MEPACQKCGTQNVIQLAAGGNNLCKPCWDASVGSKPPLGLRIVTISYVGAVEMIDRHMRKNDTPAFDNDGEAFAFFSKRADEALGDTRPGLDVLRETAVKVAAAAIKFLSGVEAREKQRANVINRPDQT